MNIRIIRPIAVISNDTNGWSKELNFVSWYHGEPVYDLRAWNEDHSKCGKGITLTIEELQAMEGALYREFETLKSVGNNHDANISIDALGLSERTYNCLKRANINTLQDIKNTPLSALRNIRGFGIKCEEEILRINAEDHSHFSNSFDVSIKESYGIDPNYIKNQNLNEMKLSDRTYNCLSKRQITDFYQLIQTSWGELKSIKGFGRKCEDELRQIFEQYQEISRIYGDDKKKTFAVKVLLLNLLLCDRIVKSGSGYNSKKIVLKLNSQYTYNLDAGKIQLDHLEAEKVNSAIESQYYLFDDLEKRQKDVNGYIGNFMILDAIDNNKKNNLPLKNALDFYLGIEKSWLIEDIKGMINDDKFFEKQGVPKEVFFKERTRRLKIIFKEFLSRDFNQNEVEIDF